jgi:hypothetical protein
VPVLCSNCGAAIDQSDINVAKDVALCRACNCPLAFSELVNAAELGEAKATPPEGCWCRDEGEEMVVGATTRSWGAVFIVPFLCVLSGVVLTDICVSPQIGPAIAFGLIAPVFWWHALMAVCGTVEVRLRPEVARVFVGIGPLGWRSQFDPAAFRSLRIRKSVIQSGRWPVYQILIEANRKVAFGGLLSNNRRNFIANVLRRTLRPAPAMTAPMG